jgi:hypothetical protein
VKQKHPKYEARSPLPLSDSYLVARNSGSALSCTVLYCPQYCTSAVDLFLIKISKVKKELLTYILNLSKLSKLSKIIPLRLAATPPNMGGEGGKR